MVNRNQLWTSVFTSHFNKHFFRLEAKTFAILAKATGFVASFSSSAIVVNFIWFRNHQPVLMTFLLIAAAVSFLNTILDFKEKAAKTAAAAATWTEVADEGDKLWWLQLASEEEMEDVPEVKAKDVDKLLERIRKTEAETIHWYERDSVRRAAQRYAEEELQSLFPPSSAS